MVCFKIIDEQMNEPIERKKLCVLRVQKQNKSNTLPKVILYFYRISKLKTIN